MKTTIGFTGSRDLKHLTIKQEDWLHGILQSNWPVHEFHHGDCFGADALVHDFIRVFYPQIVIVIHPPISNAYRAFKVADEYKVTKEYLARNRAIVEQADLVIAIPTSEEKLRSGTWSTIRYAKRLQKNLRIWNWEEK